MDDKTTDPFAGISETERARIIKEGDEAWKMAPMGGPEAARAREAAIAAGVVRHLAARPTPREQTDDAPEPIDAGERLGAAYARRCSTASLLQVLLERAGTDGDDVTAAELAEVEALEFITSLRPSSRALTLLKKLVREVAARRVMAQSADTERAHLRKVLGQIQWSGESKPGEPNTCPWCDAEEDEGHAGACEIAAALALKPVDRTPGTVLPSMLKAYQEAALDAETAFVLSGYAGGYVSTPLMRAMTRGCEKISHQLATLRACPQHSVVFHDQALRADYEARLAGTTPLDAPPPAT